MSHDDSSLFSTHTKILIADWPVLRGILDKNTTYIKHRTTEHNDYSQLPTDRALKDALEGPFQPFFKLQLSTYGTLARVRFLLTTTQDENFKTIHPAPLSPELSKISIDDLDKIQKILDTQCQSHYDQWQAFLSHVTQKLIVRLAEHHIPLTDTEKKEFQDQEPVSELWDFITELHLDIPKPTAINFVNYLQTKMHLAIHSSLNRRQQPHEIHEIHHLLKKLKHDFDAIRKEETEILNQQKAETLPLIAPLQNL